MKDSTKANLIIFFIIAIMAFCVSTAFAGLTVKEDSESYKLIPIENNSFEPNYIKEVPTYVAKPVNNTTITNNTTTFNNTILNQLTWGILKWMKRKNLSETV